MAKALLLLLLSILSIKPILISSDSDSDTNFIKKSCNVTTYPSLCVQSLLPYAASIQQSPYKLAQASLSVSLGTAQSTKTFVYKLTSEKAREMAAIKDCKEEIDDTVDRLSESIKELKNVSQDFQWHISNVQTWVSAALTDVDTCADGFSEKALNGSLKSSIQTRMDNTTQVISNALALINNYASKH